MRPETPGDGFKFVNGSDGSKRATDEYWDTLGRQWRPLNYEDGSPFYVDCLYRRRIPEPVKPVNPEPRFHQCIHGYLEATGSSMNAEQFHLARRFWDAGVTWARGQQ